MEEGESIGGLGVGTEEGGRAKERAGEKESCLRHKICHRRRRWRGGEGAAFLGGLREAVGRG